MAETTRSKRLKEMSDRSRFWDAEFLLRNFEDEMLRMESGLDHMICDNQDRLVTIRSRPLPITPSFEVEENEREFILRVKLPGIPRENVHLNVDTGSIEVMACKDDGICRPYYIRVDSRSVLDVNSAQAELSEGVLKARVEKTRKRRLEVR